MGLFNKTKYVGRNFDRYTIEALIGEGKYGICYIAKSDIGQKVIIKKFKLRMLKKNGHKNVYEAVILSGLKDKRIPQFLGIINEKDFYGYVLEFKGGVTIEEMIFKYKHKFSSEEFFLIGIKLIRIIKYLHQNGIVHRDIRIPNVLIDNDEVYLIDFGLARWVDSNKYQYKLDFSFLGELLLYLLYSSFETKEKYKKLPWYKELNLTSNQKLFFKKLLRLELEYESISDIEVEFITAFNVNTLNVTKTN